MANVNPPKKNQAFSFTAGLDDMAVAGALKNTPTLASGDFKIDKDGAGFNNLGTLPTVTPAANVAVLFTLTNTEMNADIVTIIGVDQTTPKEWADFYLCILTTA